MSITNQQRVGKGLELLREGLAGFVERELRSRFGERVLAEAQGLLGTDRLP